MNRRGFLGGLATLVVAPASAVRIFARPRGDGTHVASWVPCYSHDGTELHSYFLLDPPRHVRFQDPIRVETPWDESPMWPIEGKR